MAVNRERKMINTPVESADWTYVRLGDIQTQLTAAINRHGPNAMLDWHTLPYDETRYLYIFADVPETDEAMATRIANEELYEERRVARDRAEFERLSKMFGNNG
jgi:hypothetical protein